MIAESGRMALSRKKLPSAFALDRSPLLPQESCANWRIDIEGRGRGPLAFWPSAVFSSLFYRRFAVIDRPLPVGERG